MSVASARRTGIIPARAGFTRPRPARARRSQDHPRSRGVYTKGSSCRITDAGSSPLARGLQLGRCRAAPGRRIIPARAGFTGRSRRTAAKRVDHPRSRGVYTPSSGPPSPPSGSSPLARGLRRGGAGRPGGRRIIPARAGFTCCRAAPGCTASDHPRSRGVYTKGSSCRITDAGSSPLARGLQLGRCRAAPGRRIIPARAGFTGRSRRTAAKRVDHPRSRGVYTPSSGPPSPPSGSSPLARGLRRGGAGRPGGRRIIPARAGFTCCRAAPGCTASDHPRSRGVY